MSKIISWLHSFFEDEDDEAYMMYWRGEEPIG